MGTCERLAGLVKSKGNHYVLANQRLTGTKFQLRCDNKNFIRPRPWREQRFTIEAE